MDKNNFYYMAWYTSKNKYIEGFINKDQIEGIYRDPDSGKAIIATKTNNNMLIEASYEDVLIDLFNQ